jgi:hypothetical protein
VGLPPDVILQIYEYLDSDTLLRVENSELHRQIASTISKLFSIARTRTHISNTVKYAH